jgi:three-Cys-motif partner protein
MAKKQPLPTIDPIDNLPIGEVGVWVLEKHERLRKYVDAAGAARAKYVPPNGQSSASYVELFCGAGRSVVRETGKIIDGSAIVAYKAARQSVARFSDLHLSDLDPRNSAAAAARIKALGGASSQYAGAAEKAVDQVLHALNPHGLHLAFLDPFSLGQLPFSIIEKMLRFKRMDMIIHVSLQDLQRNLDEYSSIGDPTLDNFAPGWRNEVDTLQSIASLRAALVEYWLTRIRSLGSKPATGIPLIVGEKNQRLYWLVFVSSDSLGHKLWNDVQNLGGQKSLFG